MDLHCGGGVSGYRRRYGILGKRCVLSVSSKFHTFSGDAAGLGDVDCVDVLGIIRSEKLSVVVVGGGGGTGFAFGTRLADELRD